MASTLSFFVAFARKLAGVVTDFGSLVTPISEVTLTDGSTLIDSEITIAAGAQVTLWNWADTSGFELFYLRILSGAANLDLGIRTDVPTSLTDQTPLSTGPWGLAALSTTGCFVLTSDRQLYNPTAASQTGDTGGYPTAWTLTGSSTVTGTISKVTAKNNTGAAIRVQRIVIQ